MPIKLRYPLLILLILTLYAARENRAFMEACQREHSFNTCFYSNNH